MRYEKNVVFIPLLERSSHGYWPQSFVCLFLSCVQWRSLQFTDVQLRGIWQKQICYNLVSPFTKLNQNISSSIFLYIPKMEYKNAASHAVKTTESVFPFLSTHFSHQITPAPFTLTLISDEENGWNWQIVFGQKIIRNYKSNGNTK